MGKFIFYMRISRIFFLTMGFFVVLSGLAPFPKKGNGLLAAENGKIQEQIEEIDRQIGELKEMKKGYESRAIRHENLGYMQQFESEFTLETRRHYELADQNREMAAKIQKDIDRLEAKKLALLKKGKE